MLSQQSKIDQRYEVIKNLGGGLSGEVLLVKDHEGEKALKFLKKVQMNLSREEALQNFKNEFSILKELNHPNIARILDFGYDQKIQKYYFTSEFIHGKEFHEACENQPLPVVEKTIVQVLRALNYLHSRSIYHFDIKPQNILVCMDKNEPVQAKIIDFGLAGFTSSRKKGGTPAYMAPEVMLGGVLDGRTDLYSFGILIYKVLTGENPFTSKNLKEILDRQLSLKPSAPSALNPAVPPYWDHIVERLLEKNPVQRYSQASLVIRDLNFLSDKKFEVETKDTKLSYLPEKGTLIGRDQEWQKFVALFNETFLSDHLPDDKILIIQGHKGSGKTRMLNEIKYYSQLRNVPAKTLSQYKSEEKNDNFILLIDGPVVGTDAVNILVQELSQNKCLIVWATEKAPKNWNNHRIITLKNYDKGELKLYLESVTGLPRAPEKLINEVYKRTQGNPLFVAEFIKSLIAQDLLFDSSGKWDARTFDDISIDFNKIHIPTSVEEYLDGKFSALSAEKREIVIFLALNSNPMHSENIAKAAQLKDIHTHIDKLVQDDVIEKTSHGEIYYFKNLLFVDIVHKKIATAEAEKYHDKLAEIYKGEGEKNRPYLFHKGHGSDHGAAKKALFTLGKIYLEQPDYDNAVSVFRHMTTLSYGQFDDLDIEAHFKLGQAYTNSRHYDEAIATYNHLLSELEKCEAKEKKLENMIATYDQLIMTTIKKGDVEGTKKHLSLVRDYLPKSKNKKPYTLIFKNYDAYTLLKQGKLDGAQKIYQETDKAWHEELDENEKQMVTNNRLIEVYLMRLEFDKVIRTCEQNIQNLKKLNNKFLLALNYLALGNVYDKIYSSMSEKNKSQSLEKCIESFTNCENIARETKDYVVLLSAFNGLGNIYTHEKNWSKALDYYNRALTIARQIDDLFNAALISYNIGNILLESKQYKDAYAYFVYAINTLQNPREQWSPHSELNLFYSYIQLACLHANSKDFKKAHQALDSAEKLLAETDYLKFLAFWKYIRRSQICYGEGNQEKGLELLKKAQASAKTEDEKDEIEKVKVYIKSLDQPDGEPPTFTMKGGMKIMPHTQSHATGEDLKKIIEINKLINSEYDTNHLLKIVLNYALQLSNAEAGFVLLIDENGEFKVRESMNTNKADEEKISMSIVHMAIEGGEIVSSSDALSDERFDASESIVLNELKSVLCLPIRSKNKSIGVFYLDNRYRINAFDHCNIDLLNAFCDQVGIAFENSRLIHQLMNAQQQLQHKLEETTEELAEVKNILKEESEIYKTKFAYKHIISESQSMHEIFKLLDKVTETTLSVFIHGESGTGKELVAKALHYNNPTRHQKRFVAINCGAIPTNLMESELFGHKSGSFTGAIRDKKGLFEEADGGTIFLDEIGELDGQLQVKLLRVLQEGEVQRIGETNIKKVNVRVLCASLRNLEDLVKQKKFREDLFYRLCQMKIELPPLRERTEDIPLLAKHFVQKFKEQNNIEGELAIPPIFMKALIEYNWPGNVRELENLIHVACALKDGDHLRLENIPPNYGIMKVIHFSSDIQSNLADISMSTNRGVLIDETNPFDPKKTWADYESVIITKCYESNGKRKLQTAESLGVSHSTIYKKISDLNLDDNSNPLYADAFVYTQDTTMKSYVVKIFAAALKFHDNHPYAAIRQLAVSQGYFYKIMKKSKTEAVTEEAVPHNTQ